MAEKTSRNAKKREFQEALMQLIKDYKNDVEEPANLLGTEEMMDEIESALQQNKDVLTDYFDHMLNTMNTLRERLDEQSEADATQAPISRETLSDYAELMTFMSHAYLAWVTSGYRYWGRLTNTYGAYQQALGRSLLEMQRDPERRPEERRVLTDTVRAYLREMSNLPFQESRLLQAKLEKIAREMRWFVEDEDGAKMPSARRFVRAKP